MLCCIMYTVLLNCVGCLRDDLSTNEKCRRWQVLALGLLEDPQNKRAIGLPRRTEVLHRFLLSQLDKEAKEPALPPIPPSASKAPTPAKVRIIPA